MYIPYTPQKSSRNLALTERTVFACSMSPAIITLPTSLCFFVCDPLLLLKEYEVGLC